MDITRMEYTGTMPMTLTQFKTFVETMLIGQFNPGLDYTLGGIIKLDGTAGNDYQGVLLDLDIFFSGTQIN